VDNQGCCPRGRQAQIGLSPCSSFAAAESPANRILTPTAVLQPTLRKNQHLSRIGSTEELPITKLRSASLLFGMSQALWRRCYSPVATNTILTKGLWRLLAKAFLDDRSNVGSQRRDLASLHSRFNKAKAIHGHSSTTAKGSTIQYSSKRDDLNPQRL